MIVIVTFACDRCNRYSFAVHRVHANDEGRRESWGAPLCLMHGENRLAIVAVTPVLDRVEP